MCITCFGHDERWVYSSDSAHFIEHHVALSHKEHFTTSVSMSSNALTQRAQLTRDSTMPNSSLVPNVTNAASKDYYTLYVVSMRLRGGEMSHLLT